VKIYLAKHKEFENSNNKMKLLFGFIAKCYWRNFADLISLLSSPAHFQLNFQYVFKYLLNQSKTYLKLKILFVFDVRFYAKALN